MPARHQMKVERIAAAVKDFSARRVPFRVYHGSTNSTRILSFNRSEMVDVSDLDVVLAIDAERRIVTVEPNVAMDKLVQATLRRGLVPPVIPEFPGITVGGAVQGGAGESSSFKWGFFSQTVNRIEYVLPDGEVMQATPTENADLFYGGAGAAGTLGVITEVEVQLIDAKRFVELTYMPVASHKESVSTMQSLARDDYDFVDGIMFAPDCGVMVAGKLTDTKQGKVRRFSRSHDPWYYLQAGEIASKREQVIESVPLLDYLFRYNRGAFWVGRYAFDRFGVPFNRFYRWLLNPILNTRKLYQALQESGASQEHIVQDLTLPLGSTEQFLQYIDDTMSVYPLWLCPIKPEVRSPLLCNALDTSLAINIGVWGPRIADYDEFKKLNRDIEAELSKSGGKKWLYAHTYYTETEFWKIYDKQWYEKLRQKYHATYLPSVFDKVIVQKRYPVQAKQGLLRTIFGTAKLRVRD